MVSVTAGKSSSSMVQKACGEAGFRSHLFSLNDLLSIVWSPHLHCFSYYKNKCLTLNLDAFAISFTFPPLFFIFYIHHLFFHYSLFKCFKESHMKKLIIVIFTSCSTCSGSMARSCQAMQTADTNSKLNSPHRKPIHPAGLSWEMLLITWKQLPEIKESKSQR